MFSVAKKRKKYIYFKFTASIRSNWFLLMLHKLCIQTCRPIFLNKRNMIGSSILHFSGHFRCFIGQSYILPNFITLQINVTKSDRTVKMYIEITWKMLKSTSILFHLLDRQKEPYDGLEDPFGLHLLKA